MRRSTFFLALQIVFVTTLHLSAAAADNSLSLLPMSGPVQAKVMQIGMTREAQVTAEKLRAALDSQPDWAKVFIANSVPGRALPYHPNLRITEDEYTSFLIAAEKPTLVQVGTVNLSTKKQQNGEIRLVTDPATSRVNGLTISPDEKYITTPLATLTDMKPINNQNVKGATGRWTGTQWQYETISSGQVVAVKFAVGRRTDHDDCIIYYDVKNVRDGQNDTYYEILLIPLSK